MRRALGATLVLVAGCSGGGGPVTAPSWVERIAAARRVEPGRKPPLLVLLHGIGADENDLFPLARRLDPRLTVVSLCAPHDYVTGHAWFHIDFLPGGKVVPDVEQARASLAELVAWVEAAPARLGTDPGRTALLGFSQGAMMSLGVLRTIPDRLAGVVALSGRVAGDLFEATAPRDAIARVPLLVAHGTLDDLLPVANGRQTRDAFQDLSRDFTYREFPIGHGIAPDELELVASWLAKHL